MKNIIKDLLPKQNVNQKRNKVYGLNRFERKLLSDWLGVLGINNATISVEQRLKYIQYPGFQMLLQSYRDTKKVARMTAVKLFFKQYFKKNPIRKIFALIILSMLGSAAGMVAKMFF